jgi:hypothetical protein
VLLELKVLLDGHGDWLGISDSRHLMGALRLIDTAVA